MTQNTETEAVLALIPSLYGFNDGVTPTREAADTLRALLAERDAARAEVAVLREALADCLERMEQLRASGDSGFWDWRDGDEYQRGVAALANTTALKKGE